MLLFCSLWKKRHTLCCGWSTSSNHRTPSEGDSAGSCYAPPHYSRCSSFYHAPPCYTEVTSKPDLYPLVFSYASDGSKGGNSGANYLMVQYFRNYIVRPIGSLSATTSTVDSLSSSFICNANEAIPPPYSSAASPDGLSISLQNYSIPRSASQQGYMMHPISVPVDSLQLARTTNNNRPMSVPNTNENSNNSYHQVRPSESANFVNLFRADEETCASSHPSNQNQTSSSSTLATTHTGSSRNKNANVVSDDDDDEFQQASSQNSIGNGASVMNFEGHKVSSIYHSNETMLSLSAQMMDKISYSRQTNDHTKLNMIQKQLEKCCEMIQQQQQQIQQTHFNVSTSFDCTSPISGNTPKNINDSPMMGLGYMNSNTGSTVSSLANLNSPGSPPQATSPTQEVKDLLEQIRQLKDTNFSDDDLGAEHKVNNNPQPSTSFKSMRPTSLSSKSRFFGMKNRSSAYSPIANNSFTSPSSIVSKMKSPISGATSVFMVKARGSVKNRAGQFSKSAPTTPAGLPSSFLSDHSPLLNEQDEESG